ncbi:GNAT family N-acetyltransferase [Chloroflexota bacterium]
MEIINLSDEYEKLYHVCLEDWSDEMEEAGDHKEAWYNRMKDKGLRVKLALDNYGQVGGMIQYIPIEHSFAEGENLYFVNCIWVHGHKQGRGNFQKQGMGKAMLQAAEEDAMALGVNGIAAWGIPLPFWMKASWFKKQGYKKVDQQGFLGQVLLWKPFNDDAVPPTLIKPNKKPDLTPGVVTVTALLNGWCPAQNIVFERAKRASAKYGSDVVFQPVDTFNRDNLLKWGISDALFIDGKQVRTGPPPSYEKIRKIIASRVSKL